MQEFYKFIIYSNSVYSWKALCPENVQVCIMSMSCNSLQNLLEIPISSFAFLIPTPSVKSYHRWPVVNGVYLVVFVLLAFCPVFILDLSEFYNFFTSRILYFCIWRKKLYLFVECWDGTKFWLFLGSLSSSSLHFHYSG